jgi:hypothetical protein
MDRLSGVGCCQGRGEGVFGAESAFLNTVLFLGKNQRATFDFLASFKMKSCFPLTNSMAYKSALSIGFLISFHHAQVRGDGRISGSVGNSSL